MHEVWLKSNTRALALGLVPVALVESLGLTLAAVGWVLLDNISLVIAGGALAAIASIVMVSLVLQWSQPRIARQDDEVLLFVRSGLPVRVPLEVVEGFLLGQGPTMLAGASHELETSTLVVKLADKAEEWQKIDVKAAIASWCGGYVTIRGTWCEPLSVSLVTQLNQRLYDAKQSHRVSSKA